MPLASAVCSDRELPPKGRGRCFSKTGLTTELDFGAGKTSTDVYCSCRVPLWPPDCLRGIPGRMPERTPCSFRPFVERCGGKCQRPRPTYERAGKLCTYSSDSCFRLALHRGRLR